MTKIRELVSKIRTEYGTESVIADLSKTGEFNRINDESLKDFRKFGKDQIV